jgi:hypothetical protein
MSNIYNSAFTKNQSWMRTFSTQGLDTGHTINYRTSRQNNQTEREFKSIKAIIKKMNLTLKQLKDAEANEKVLEANKSYKLEIYRERTPCYVKVHIRRDRNPINFYMRMDENEDLDENEG